MRLRALMLLAALLGIGTAHAASIASVNPQQLQIPATGADFNALIAAINAIVTPLIPNVSGSVNTISLTPGITGTPAIIGLQPGADTNTGITISPNGSGAITIFSQADTGVLQYGNQSSFVPGNGIDRCPGSGGIAHVITGGVLAGTAGGLPNNVVRGYFINSDWMGRQYALVAC